MIHDTRPPGRSTGKSRPAVTSGNGPEGTGPGARSSGRRAGGRARLVSGVAGNRPGGEEEGVRPAERNAASTEIMNGRGFAGVRPVWKPSVARVSPEMRRGGP